MSLDFGGSEGFDSGDALGSGFWSYDKDREDARDSDYISDNDRRFIKNLLWGFAITAAAMFSAGYVYKGMQDNKQAPQEQLHEAPKLQP